MLVESLGGGVKYLNYVLRNKMTTLPLLVIQVACFDHYIICSKDLECVLLLNYVYLRMGSFTWLLENCLFENMEFEYMPNHLFCLWCQLSDCWVIMRLLVLFFFNNIKILLWLRRAVSAVCSLFSPPSGHRNWVLCIAWSPDGKYLVSGSKAGELICWDPQTGKALGNPLMVCYLDWVILIHYVRLICPIICI